MDDSDIRALITALPDAAAFVPRPREYVAKGRPDAASLDGAETELQELDAWVLARGGQVRTGRGPSAGGVRPGRRAAPPPPAPRRYYVLPAAALRG